MKIAIDIDDVLADFTNSLIRYHNDTYGTSLTIEQFGSYRFWEVWGGTKQEAIKKVKDFFKSHYSDNIVPVDGSVNCVNLIVPNNELIIVTSRPPYLVKKTQNWVQKYFPNIFLATYFTNNHYTGWGQIKRKSDLCLDLSIDIIIEDSLEYALECSEERIHVLLLTRPWNKSWYLPHRITRVQSWEEILEKLSSFKLL